MKIAIGLNVVMQVPEAGFKPTTFPRNSVPGAVEAIKQLRKDGHDVAVVANENFYKELRLWFNQQGLNWTPVYVGIGHRAGFCRDNQYDMLIDDHLPYLKGANTVGLWTIHLERKAVRPSDLWGEAGTKRFGVQSWKGALHFVDLIMAGKDSHTQRLAKEAQAKQKQDVKAKLDEATDEHAKMLKVLALLDEITELMED